MLLKSIGLWVFAASGTAAAAQAPLAVDLLGPLVKWGPCPGVFPAGCEITIVQGNPAQPNADVVLRVPAGYDIPPHRHTSAERMILVNGRLQVHYQGSPAAVLNAGNYAYGPAGMPHKARCLGPESCTLFIAFEGPVDAEAVETPIE